MSETQQPSMTVDLSDQVAVVTGALSGDWQSRRDRPRSQRCSGGMCCS